MTNRVLAGVVLLFSLSGKAQESKPVVHLTLEKAIEIALSESPTVNIADLEIRKKEYSRKTTQSALYPQIDAIGKYTRTLQKQVMYMDGAFDMKSMFTPALMGMEQTLKNNIPGYTDGELMQNFNQIYDQAMSMESSDEGIEVGRDNDWMGGLNLNWPVIVPTLWKSLQISSLDVELAVEAARASRINMSNDVKRAYYGLLMAQDACRVFKESYENALMNYTDIKNKFDQGLVAEFEVIRADVTVKNEKPNLIQAENAYNLAALSLKALMGMDMDQEIAVEGSLKDYEELLFAEMLQADTSLGNNSDLKQFDIQSEQLKKTLELYKAQYWPVVSISGSYMYMSMNNDFRFADYKWNPYSTVGLTVSVPLFDGFKKSSEVRQTKVALEQMKWQREDIVRKLTLSVKNSVSSMTNFAEQVFSTRDAVKLAKKGYDISQKRYSTGMGTLLELNDSQLSYTQASLMYNQAIYNYLAAKTDLAKTLGLE